MAGPSTASATVTIKLNVTGDKSAKLAIERFEKKFTNLDKSVTSLDSKLDGLSTKLERHNELLHDSERKWSASKLALSELRGEIGNATKDFDTLSRSVSTLHKTHLVPLNKELQRKRADFERLGTSMKEVNREFTTSRNQSDAFRKSLNRYGGDRDGIFKRIFGPAIKFIKLFGIEFLAMSAIIGGFRGVLYLGELAVRGFQASLTGLGAAAGTAVAALGTVLAAVRELQVAKLAPFFAATGVGPTGSSNMFAQVSSITGARELQMFDQKTLGSIATEGAKTGLASDAALRQMLGTLGDFAIVATDPNKAMSELAATFIKAYKEGYITADAFKTISEASPELAKGLEEMYGGTKGLESALASGKVSTKGFLQAIEDGRLKTLLPFQNALEGVNDTLIGTFKGALAPLKEQLIEIGMPLVETLKRPVLVLERELRILLMRIAPTIQSTFGTLFEGFGKRGGAFERFMTGLARLINESLPKLIGLGGRIREWANSVGEWFGKLGDYLRRMSESWDVLYKNILRPIGVEIVKTFNYAVEAFGSTIQDNAKYGESFAARIDDIGEGVRRLIDGFVKLKQVLAPIIDTFMLLLQIVSQLLGATGGFGQLLGATALTGAFMNRRARKSGRGGAGGGGGMGAAGMFLSPFMFPFGMAGRRGGGGGGGGGLLRGTYQTYQSALSYINQRPAAPGSVNPAADSRAYARQQAATFFSAGAKTFFKTAAKNTAIFGLPMIGSMIGGTISANAAPTDETGRAIGGAISGASIGASIGTMIAPGIGTAIGAALGGVTGFFTSRSAARQEQKRVEEADAETLAARAYEGISASNYDTIVSGYLKNTQAISFLQGYQTEVGKTEGLLKNLRTELDREGFNGMFSDEELTNVEKLSIALKEDVFGENIKTAMKSLERNLLAIQGMEEAIPELKTSGYDKTLSETEKLLDAQKQQMTIATSNLSLLSETLGMSSDEAADLAESLNLDLVSSFYSLDEVIKILGYSTDELANRATAAGRIMADAMGPIEERRMLRDMNSRYQAAGKAFVDTVFASSAEAMPFAEDYTQAVLERELQLYQTGETGSYDQFVSYLRQSLTGQLNLLTEAYGPRSGNVLALQSLINEMLPRLTNPDLPTRLQYDPDFAFTLDERVGEIVKGLTSRGLSGEGKAVVDTAVRSVEEFLRKEYGITDTSGVYQMVLGEFQKDAESVGKNTDKLITALAEQFANMRMNIDGKIAIDVSASGITTTGIVGVSGSEVNPTNIKPQGSSIGGYIPGGRRDADFDTSTPRAGRIGDTLSSRLGRTLARHAQFNSMIAGSRMVTSAYRTDMLGSINSDHVTGRAYDLTGDNLGQYANLVNDSGGFAEFHGSAGSRHLHVVPPQGDAATPAAGMSTLAPSGGVTINAPITVNARDGQSAREIARIVLDQLAALQRTARERQ